MEMWAKNQWMNEKMQQMEQPQKNGLFPEKAIC